VQPVGDPSKGGWNYAGSLGVRGGGRKNSRKGETILISSGGETPEWLRGRRKSRGKIPEKLESKEGPRKGLYHSGKNFYGVLVWVYARERIFTTYLENFLVQGATKRRDHERGRLPTSCGEEFPGLNP